MYVLLDANVTAAYYLPRSTRYQRVKDRIEILFDSVRSGESDHFFYLPNFCVAEVFSVFMKYSFGRWNSHVQGNTIDSRYYSRIVDQFQKDIHNGQFIYHYELSRYHVLAMNLIAPVDHYFQISRGRRRTSGRNAGQVRRPNVNPMGTFDHLIISMGIHLAHLHGRDNVVIVSSDDRLTNVLAKCKTPISNPTRRKLRLDKAENLTGKPFSPGIFPTHINLKTAKKSDLETIFGMWPLSIGKLPKVGRYKG